jgi:hypothetical protein
MTDEFTEARRNRVMDALKKAARELIEMESLPFAEAHIPLTARGHEYTLSIKLEGRSK